MEYTKMNEQDCRWIQIPNVLSKYDDEYWENSFKEDRRIKIRTLLLNKSVNSLLNLNKMSNYLRYVQLKQLINKEIDENDDLTDVSEDDDDCIEHLKNGLTLYNNSNRILNNKSLNNSCGIKDRKKRSTCQYSKNTLDNSSDLNNESTSNSSIDSKKDLKKTTAKKSYKKVLKKKSNSSNQNDCKVTQLFNGIRNFLTSTPKNVQDIKTNLLGKLDNCSLNSQCQIKQGKKDLNLKIIDDQKVFHRYKIINKEPRSKSTSINDFNNFSNINTSSYDSTIGPNMGQKAEQNFGNYNCDSSRNHFDQTHPLENRQDIIQDLPIELHAEVNNTHDKFVEDKIFEDNEPQALSKIIKNYVNEIEREITPSIPSVVDEDNLIQKVVLQNSKRKRKKTIPTSDINYNISPQLNKFIKSNDLKNQENKDEDLFSNYDEPITISLNSLHDEEINSDSFHKKKKSRKHHDNENTGSNALGKVNEAEKKANRNQSSHKKYAAPKENGDNFKKIILGKDDVKNFTELQLESSVKSLVLSTSSFNENMSQENEWSDFGEFQIDIQDSKIRKKHCNNGHLHKKKEKKRKNVLKSDQNTSFPNQDFPGTPKDFTENKIENVYCNTLLGHKDDKKKNTVMDESASNENKEKKHNSKPNNDKSIPLKSIEEQQETIKKSQQFTNRITFQPINASNLGLDDEMDPESTQKVQKMKRLNLYDSEDDAEELDKIQKVTNIINLSDSHIVNVNRSLLIKKKNIRNPVGFNENVSGQTDCEKNSEVSTIEEDDFQDLACYKTRSNHGFVKDEEISGRSTIKKKSKNKKHGTLKNEIDKDNIGTEYQSSALRKNQLQQESEEISRNSAGESDQNIYKHSCDLIPQSNKINDAPDDREMNPESSQKIQALKKLNLFDSEDENQEINNTADAKLSNFPTNESSERDVFYKSISKKEVKSKKHRIYKHEVCNNEVNSELPASMIVRNHLQQEPEIISQNSVNELNGYIKEQFCNLSQEKNDNSVYEDNDMDPECRQKIQKLKRLNLYDSEDDAEERDKIESVEKLLSFNKDSSSERKIINSSTTKQKRKNKKHGILNNECGKGDVDNEYQSSKLSQNQCQQELEEISQISTQESNQNSYQHSCDINLQCNKVNDTPDDHEMNPESSQKVQALKRLNLLDSDDDNQVVDEFVHTKLSNLQKNESPERDIIYKSISKREAKSKKHRISERGVCKNEVNSESPASTLVRNHMQQEPEMISQNSLNSSPDYNNLDSNSSQKIHKLKRLDLYDSEDEGDAEERDKIKHVKKLLNSQENELIERSDNENSSSKGKTKNKRKSTSRNKQVSNDDIDTELESSTYNEIQQEKIRLTSQEPLVDTIQQNLLSSNENILQLENSRRHTKNIISPILDSSDICIQKKKIIEIADLIEEEQLDLQSFNTTINLSDISDNEEIYLFEIPSETLIKPKQLIGERFKVSNNHLHIGKRHFKTRHRPNETVSCVFQHGKNQALSTVNIRPVQSAIAQPVTNSKNLER